MISLEVVDAIEPTSHYFLWGFLQVSCYSVLTSVLIFKLFTSSRKQERTIFNQSQFACFSHKTSNILFLFSHLAENTALCLIRKHFLTVRKYNLCWKVNSTSCNSMELAKSQSQKSVQRKQFSVVISFWRWKPIHCVRNYLCDLKTALFLILWAIFGGWKQMNKKGTIIHPQNVWCSSSDQDSHGDLAP